MIDVSMITRNWAVAMTANACHRLGYGCTGVTEDHSFGLNGSVGAIVPAVPVKTLGRRCRRP
jgi:hypothetical protein